MVDCTFYCLLFSTYLCSRSIMKQGNRRWCKNAEILCLYHQNVNKCSCSPQHHINTPHGMCNVIFVFVLVFSVGLNECISLIWSVEFVQLLFILVNFRRHQTRDTASHPQNTWILKKTAVKNYNRANMAILTITFVIWQLRCFRTGLATI